MVIPSLVNRCTLTLHRTDMQPHAVVQGVVPNMAESVSPEETGAEFSLISLFLLPVAASSQSMRLIGPTRPLPVHG